MAGSYNKYSEETSNNSKKLLFSPVRAIFPEMLLLYLYRPWRPL